MHEACRCQWRAQTGVNEERDVLEAWDPEAMPEGDQEGLRRQLMARDRTGSVGQAREAARRATALARTPDEVYAAAMERARIECDAGDHEAEQQQARRLMDLRPHNRLSWMVLRRAARCTGRSTLVEETLRWLRTTRETDRSPWVSGNRSAGREGGP